MKELMKKMHARLLLFILIFPVLFFVKSTGVYSQSPSPSPGPVITTSPTPEGEFNYDRAYQDYTYNYYLCDKNFYDYQSARAKFLQIGTLAAQDEAKAATIVMLVARDKVVETYLTALRMKLKETPAVVTEEKDSVFARIDKEVAWFMSHATRLPSAQTLNDLVTDSNEAKERYNLTQTTIYLALIEIGAGQTHDFRDRLTENDQTLRAKIEGIRLAGDKDLVAIERAMVDIDNKLARSQEKETEAKNLVYSIKSSDKDKTKGYETALARLQDSFLYLKEVSASLQEIIRQIKTQD